MKSFFFFVVTFGYICVLMNSFMKKLQRHLSENVPTFPGLRYCAPVPEISVRAQVKSLDFED